MSEIISTDYSKSDLTEIQYTKINVKTSWLIISDNKIRRIPDEIENLKYLTRLAANDNQIQVISPLICNLQNLTWVDFTRNKLKNLPVNFHNLNKITGLGLSENEFDEIPFNIYKMINLRKFGFFSNRIKKILPDIKYLRNLVKIDLSNNLLTSLPDEICELTYLNWLNLSNNKLLKLPSNFNNLIHLEELGLGMNKLVELPCMDKLYKLRILPIFKNNLKDIEISLRYCKSLEKLDFSDNEIDKLPDFLLDLPNLRYLNLKSNKINKIEIEKIEFIKSQINMIDLSDNKLDFVPFKFFKIFSNASTIKISDNPYNKPRDLRPLKISLLEKCYNKILNLKYQINPYINVLFKKIRVCDVCHNFYVNFPYYIYSPRSVEEDEHFVFVVEKVCCSVICYNKEFVHQ
ncbi:leucine-rich repeat-containing protein [Vairimorpha necatrix]|uniref:Leucine-rich repeat-containing protein n=1 Tax=Vairimorpha necatrix TaxID=6039 RepID=A0AAX4JA43_9MICR